eukprot:scaffold2136_cov242-Pinguiococcus_pyrenoidosus.AAC.17
MQVWSRPFSRFACRGVSGSRIATSSSSLSVSSVGRVSAKAKAASLDRKVPFKANRVRGPVSVRKTSSAVTAKIGTRPPIYSR